LDREEETRKKGGHVQKRAHAPPRWIAPHVGVVKINVNTTLGKNMNKGELAAVARDTYGCFLGASVVNFLGCSELETLEALAYGEVISLATLPYREAISLVSDILETKVLVASDCLSDVKIF
jgi:hypothetical protein